MAYSSDDIKEINRLIELKKKKEEHEREMRDVENQELMRLLTKHRAFSDLDSTAMKKKLNEEAPEKKYDLSGPEQHQLILKDYYAKFKNQPGFKEPQQEDGKTVMTFKSEAEAIEFFSDQASKNRSFEVYDHNTKQLLAYSKGDGKMYHADGSEFKKGDALGIQVPDAPGRGIHG